MSRNIPSVATISPNEKLETYFHAIERSITEILATGKSPYPNNGETINNLIEQTLLFVRDNSILLTTTGFQKRARLNAGIYNNMAEALYIDMQAAFARIRATMKVINNTTQFINSRTYKMLGEIDEMLDKIENLSKLRRAGELYDNIVHDTFINDTNNEDDIDFRSMHQEAGGIITINDTYSDEIIKNERNFDLFMLPLNRNTMMAEHSRETTSTSMVNSLDVSLYSYRNLYIKNYEVGRGTDGLGVQLTYNGATLAVILRLPSIKFINNISMKFSAGGLLDVVDMYYSEESAVDILNHVWHKIYYTIDKNNIRGSSINFETVQAGSIMLILGQKSLKRVYTSRVPALSITKDDSTKQISELLNKLSYNSNVTSPVGKIQEYVRPDVAKTLDDSTRKIVSSMIDEVEKLLPVENPEDNPQSTANQTDYTEILEYNFGIYELRASYYHYKTSSVYRSQSMGGDGKISDIKLTTTGNEPDGTVINHYIQLENGEHRILPNNIRRATDVITVEDKTQYTYETEVLLDTTEDIEVTVNESTVDSLLIYPVKPYPSSTVATGITIDSSIQLNFGDLITISYKTPLFDTVNRRYRASDLNIENKFGNPAIKNQLLVNGNTNRFVVKNIDSTYRSYDIPTEGAMKLLPASGETEEPTLGFEILSGSIKDSDSVLPHFFYSTLGYAISGENVAYGSKRIYYGFVDEAITANGDTTFNTANPYAPGSLHVSHQGQEIPVDEYETDLVSVIPYDKTEFTTVNTTGSLSGTILVSYIPIDGTISGQVTNIADRNYSQTFQKTDQDAVIKLDFFPHIDTAILKSAVSNAAPLWNFSLGKFVNVSNERIIYSPISIRIQGREIVNKTDYIANEEPTLSTFTGRNYEYYIDGKTVHFNTIINQPIDVEYYVLNDNFRFVTKMYRTNRTVDDITPELYGYSLYINERE